MSEQHAAIWKQAAQAWDERWRQIGDDQWEVQSPCDDWNVRELCEHTVGVQATFAAGLVGAHVGIGAEWPEVHEAIVDQLQDPSVLDGTSEMPAMGEVPKSMLFGIAANDLLIHTWDLARAIGADEQLPPDAVAACFAGMQRMPDSFRTADGRFKPAVALVDDADVQHQLLALVGRQP